MRRLIVLVVTCLLVAGCGSAGTSGDVGGQAGGRLPAVSSTAGRADPGTPDLVAKRKASDLEPCEPGTQTAGGLPKVTLPCLGGGTPADLASFHGPLVINFFAGWCGPCRQEMPALAGFYQAYGTKVPVIGIDTMDTKPGLALDVAIKRGVTFPLYADPVGDLQGSKLSVGKLPATFVLTQGGRIELLQMGGMKSTAQVKDLVEQKLGITL